MSINASFKMDTPTALLRKLAAVKKLDNVWLDEMNAWAGRVQNRVQTYPTQQTATYRRTGRYGRGYRTATKVSGGAIVATVQNAVPYAQYVGGDRQRSFHAAHGWPKLSEVAKKEWDSTLKKLKAAI